MAEGHYRKMVADLDAKPRHHEFIMALQQNEPMAIDVSGF